MYLLSSSLYSNHGSFIHDSSIKKFERTVQLDDSSNNEFMNYILPFVKRILVLRVGVKMDQTDQIL